MATSANPETATDLESLTCKICFSVFKEPKLLSCGHTFCFSCLHRMFKDKTSIICPFCRKGTVVPHGKVKNLTTNLALMSLVTDVMNLEGPCNMCKKVFKRKSLFYCHQCCVSMCKECKEKHHHKPKRIPELTFFIMSCMIHPREICTKVCLTCDKQLCERCEKNHPTDHRIMSDETFINEMRAKASDLREELTLLVNDCTESHQTIVREGQEVNILLSELQHTIHDKYTALAEELDRRRILLLESVEVLKSKLRKTEKEMANCTTESSDLLHKISAMIDQILRLPLHEMSSNEASLEENSRKVGAVRGRKDENTKLFCELVEGVKKMHFEQSFGQNDIRIGSLIVHDWNRTDIPLTLSTMSSAALGEDGRIAVGYLDSGVELVSQNGSNKAILKEEEVLAIAFSKRGNLVLRDSNNNISVFDTKFKKSKVRFETLRKEKGGNGDMTVNAKDELFLSYKTVRQIHVYLPQGGPAIRMINCGELIPQQISAAQNSRLMVMDASEVALIDENGKCVSKLRRAGFFGYPSVLADGSLFIAWVHIEEGNVRILQCTNQLKPSSLILIDYSLPKTDRNWYKLQLLSSDEIALISPVMIHIYRRRKSTFSENKVLV